MSKQLNNKIEYVKLLDVDNNPLGTVDGLDVSIQEPLSAFGQLSITQDTPEVQLSFLYGINEDIVITEVNGTGTVTNTDSLATISTGASATSHAYLNSKRLLKYRPGQGTSILFTCIYESTGVVGNTQIAGAGDDANGYFIGWDGVSFGINRRSDSVDNWTYQGSFSEDNLDGTGNSGMTLDKSKGNVYQISYQWLGFGAINFHIESPTTGKLFIFHRINHTNQFTVPAVLIPSFPLTARSENTTNATDRKMKVVSMAGFIQGKKLLKSGNNRTIGNSETGVSSETHVLTIRNKATFNSIVNSNVVYPIILSFSTDGTKNCKFSLYEDRLLTGETWTDINTSNSVVEYSIDPVTDTLGTKRSVFWVGGGESESINIEPLDLELIPGSTYTITAESSASTTAAVAFNWLEDL